MMLEFAIPTESGIRSAEIRLPGTEAAVKAADFGHKRKFGSACRIIAANGCPTIEPVILDLAWATCEQIAIKSWNLNKDPATEYFMDCERCGGRTFYTLEQSGTTVVNDRRARLSEMKCRGFRADKYSDCNQTFRPSVPVVIDDGENKILEITEYIVRWPTVRDMLTIESDGKLADSPAAMGRSLLHKCIVDIDGRIYDPSRFAEKTPLEYVRTTHPHKLLDFADPGDLLDLSYMMSGAGYQPVKQSVCDHCGHEQAAEVPFQNFFGFQKTSSATSSRMVSAEGLITIPS